MAAPEAAEPTSPPPASARLRDALEVLNTPFRHAQDMLRFPRSEGRMRQRIEAMLASDISPIVVYSAPKTASTSVAAALDRTPGVATVKVHFVEPAHFWPGPLAPKVAPSGLLRHRAIEQRASRELLFDAAMPLRIVSVVRDPVAFNLSNYTYFGRAYWMRSFWRSAPWLPTERIARHFLDTFPHESSSLWWTHEFARTTGCDPLAEGFDAARGWQCYRRGRFDCLVLRADLDDRAKTEALRAWTGVEVAEVARENANDTQSAPGVYPRLQRAMAQEAAYVDRMLALPAARVFFTDAQREALRSRWLASGRS
jgi:hypothetical protein